MSLAVKLPIGVVLALVNGVFAFSMPASAQPVEQAACQVTYPEGGIQGNEALQAVLPPAGKFVFVPNGGGFTDLDGGLGIKLAWNRLKRGKLNVGGRRLDGESPSARAYIYDQGNFGGQSIYLVFPTTGCWEITGRVNGSVLTFVLKVEKVGAGPSGRFEWPAPGWRVSTG